MEMGVLGTLSTHPMEADRDPCSVAELGFHSDGSIPSPHDCLSLLFTQAWVMEAGTPWLLPKEVGHSARASPHGGQLLTSTFLGGWGVHLSFPVTQPNIDFSTCQLGPGPQILDHPHAHLLGPDGLPKPTV